MTAVSARCRVPPPAIFDMISVMRQAIIIMRLWAPCIAFCAVLCGCATDVISMQWVRADGSPVDESAIEAARTACANEVRNAALSSRGPASDEVYRVCMTKRGYVQRISQ